MRIIAKFNNNCKKSITSTVVHKLACSVVILVLLFLSLADASYIIYMQTKFGFESLRGSLPWQFFSCNDTTVLRPD